MDTTKNPWYTSGFNVNIALLIVVVSVGVKYGVLNSGMVSLLVGVIATAVLAPAFPTIGGHSTGNNVLLFSVLIIALLISMGGTADFLDALKKFLTSDREADRAPVSSSIFNDIYIQMGPIFTWWQGDAQWGYSIYDFSSLCRFVAGNTYLMWLIMSNVKGPGCLVDMLSSLLNKLRQGEEQRTDSSVCPVISTSWTYSFVVSTGIAIATGYIVGLMFLIPSAILAWLMFSYEKQLWNGWGRIASIVKGRHDTTLPAGNSLGAIRVFIIWILIIMSLMSIINTMPRIMLLVIIITVVMVRDHRILCALAAILTQEPGLLVGLRSPRSLIDELSETSVSANASLEAEVGGNSENVISATAETFHMNKA